MTDWVLVATKSYDSDAAAAWFASVLGEHGRVAILQNGVTHVERFSRWLPGNRILPVIVDCPAERTGPGEIRQRGPGSLTVPSGELATYFGKLFAKTDIACKPVDDFVTAAWWKLCLNSAGVVNALLLQPAGIVCNATAARLTRHIVEEAAAVGRAEGARLSPTIADEVIDVYRSHPPDSVNSLHADRAAGRPLEIELRNGVIVALGSKHGIPTPYNDMAASLLSIS